MDAEKLSISLPADMAQMVRTHVESGAYASNSAVIQDALHHWQQRKQERVEPVELIRSGLNKAALDPVRISSEDVRRHFEERFVAAEKKRAI